MALETTAALTTTPPPPPPITAPPGPCPIINVPPWSNADRVRMVSTLDARCFLDANMPRSAVEIDARCVLPLAVASGVADVVRCWQVCCEYGANGCTTMTYYEQLRECRLYACPTLASCPLREMAVSDHCIHAN